MLRISWEYTGIGCKKKKDKKSRRKKRGEVND